jgi:transposase
VITEIGYLIAFDLPRATKALAKLIERHHGNVVEAAKEAGVSRKTFDRWLTRTNLLKRASDIRGKVKQKKEVKP